MRYSRFTPFGYAYSKANNLLEVEKRETNIVKLIYTMYISDKSTHDIAAYLNRKGYKTRTGKQFYNKFICDILKNQIYTGKIVWNKKHYGKNQKTKKHYKYIRNDPSKILVNYTNRAVKAEDIKPEATKIVAQLVQDERLKQS